MPAKKKFKIRPYVRKYGRRRRYGVARSKVGRPMKPVTYTFKRCFEELVDLKVDQGGTDGWVEEGTGLYKQFVYNLSLLPDYTDFTNLFHSYKITGVSMKMYFSNTNSGTNNTSSAMNHANSQVLMRVAPNPDGASANILTNPLSIDWFNQTSSTKRRLCLNTIGKPITTYTKLKQLGEVYHNTGNTDYTIKTPKWLSTKEPSTPHYGMNCRLDRVDGGTFTAGYNNNQVVRIIHTVYIKCRQVG